MLNNAGTGMISKNFKNYHLEETLKQFEEIFSQKGYKILKKQKMTEKNFPEIVVFTLSKDQKLFRTSFVLDKNGITITVVGIKEKNLKKEITDLLELLQ